MVFEEKRLMTHKQTNFQSVLVNTPLRKKIAPLQSRRRGMSKVGVEIKALGADQTKLGLMQGRWGGAVSAQYNYLFQCYYSLPPLQKKFWKCVNASVLTDVQTCLQPPCKISRFSVTGGKGDDLCLSPSSLQGKLSKYLIKMFASLASAFDGPPKNKRHQKTRKERIKTFFVFIALLSKVWGYSSSENCLFLSST